MLELLSVMVTVETRDRLGVTASGPRPDSPECGPGSDTVLACDSSSSTHSRPVTQVQVPVGVAGPQKHVWTVLYLRPGSESGPSLFRLAGRRPASGPVTADTLAPEDFN